MKPELWNGLFTFAGIAIGTISTHFLRRRKASADAGKAISEAAAAVAQAADEQIDRMRAWLDQANERIRQCETEAASVRSQLQAAERQIIGLQGEIKQMSAAAQAEISRLTAAREADRATYLAEVARLRLAAGPNGLPAVSD